MTTNEATLTSSFFLVICQHRHNQLEAVQACETDWEYPTWKQVNSVSPAKKLMEHFFPVTSVIWSSSAPRNARQLKDLATRAFARRSKSIKISFGFKNKIWTLSVSLWKKVTNGGCFKTFWSSLKSFVKVSISSTFYVQLLHTKVVLSSVFLYLQFVLRQIVSKGQIAKWYLEFCREV